MDVSAAPVKPVPPSPVTVQAPEVRITSAVMVQTRMVSINVPNIATMPCRTGLFVLAAAWAIAAEPKPDSLENTPRATPNRMAAATAAPAKPPVAATGVKAYEKIKARA